MGYGSKNAVERCLKANHWLLHDLKERVRGNEGRKRRILEELTTVHAGLQGGIDVYETERK